MNTLLWQSDDQGDLDSDVVIVDAYVDVLLTNTTAGPPYGLINNSAQLVSEVHTRESAHAKLNAGLPEMCKPCCLGFQSLRNNLKYPGHAEPLTV